MAVSRQMVPPSKMVASANVTPCVLVFWLLIARTSLFVVFAGIVPSVFTITGLLILVYLGEYSGVALVLVLFFWTLVNPWLTAGAPLSFSEAAAAA